MAYTLGCGSLTADRSRVAGVLAADAWVMADDADRYAEMPASMTPDGMAAYGRHGLNPAATQALGAMVAQADDAMDLAEAALLLASFDHPADDLELYRAHLRAIAEAMAAAERNIPEDRRDDPSPEAMAEALADVLAGQFRYRGDDDTYDDLDNANLMRVIERRKGLPVVLGILYLFAARSRGWAAVGLNFPGHFLIRLENRDGQRAILDPFNGGRIMETPYLRELLKAVAGQGVELEAAHYRAVSNRDILVRLQNNVKERRLALGMIETALDAVTSMQILNPNLAPLWREAGVLHMRLGRLKNAIESFEGFVARAAEGPDRRKIAQVVQELRERLH
jgi:regulator of sirC expression with transglutaminase-like and TPR domain